MSTTTALSNASGQQDLKTGLLDLNDLLRQSLKRQDARVKELNLTIRCESLPRVTGNAQEMGLLFDHLVTMILSNQPNGSRLFLYVDCQEQAESASSTATAVPCCQILFHTNINTDTGWKEANQHLLDQCKEILFSHGGTLGVNTIQNTGCLFVISLPGKKE